MSIARLIVAAVAAAVLIAGSHFTLRSGDTESGKDRPRVVAADVSGGSGGGNSSDSGNGGGGH